MTLLLGVHIVTNNLRCCTIMGHTDVGTLSSVPRDMGITSAPLPVFGLSCVGRGLDGQIRRKRSLANCIRKIDSFRN
jgi:hypothetical protein